MSDTDDAAAREYEKAVRRALDDPRRPVNDGGPPTMPTEAVRQPSMRPDPGLPDPLSGRTGRQPPQPQTATRQAPPVEQRQSTVPRPRGPSERPQPQPQPQPQPRPEQRQPGDASPQQPRPSIPPRPQQPQSDTRSFPQQGAQPQVRSDHGAPGQRGPAPRVPEQRPLTQRSTEQPPFGYPGDYSGESWQRPAGPGPGADHRQAVAEQWGDSRSARPRQKQRQKPKSKGKRKRDAKEVQGNRAREAKWAASRWAVPYFTDGPKVTLGVLWFIFLMGGALLGFNYDNSAVSSVAVALVTSTVAALAGLQIGFAWFPKNSATRTWTAIAAFVVGIAGFYGPWGVVIGLVVGMLVLTAYLILYRGHRRTSAELFDVLVRAAIPVGLASASLGAMAYRNLPVLIALILFVSAYEIGDFIVGSGAFNPVEGPMAGLIAAGVIAFFLFLIQPDPFSSETILMFVAVAAVSCVAGQYLASALLPRGNTWSPALRRLDSYLIVAPLWLLLLVLLPDIH